jgi:predicted nucleic acid-binding protein
MIVVLDTNVVVQAIIVSEAGASSRDRRHLLPLKNFGRTKIVTPTAFLRRLK